MGLISEAPQMSKAEKPKPDPPNLRLFFPKEGKVQPKGFSSAVIDKEVTVLVKGTVKEIADSAERWDPGKRFVLHISSCTINGPGEKPLTLDAAVKAAKLKKG